MHGDPAVSWWERSAYYSYITGEWVGYADSVHSKECYLMVRESHAGLDYAYGYLYEPVHYSYNGGKLVV